mgnify:CR=1 FL=1
MEQELQILKDFERSSQWFYEHIVRIRKQGFTGKFVAVKEGKVISSNKDINSLIKSLEEMGENPSYVFIEFVHPEGFTLIL